MPCMPFLIRFLLLDVSKECCMDVLVWVCGNLQKSGIFKEGNGVKQLTIKIC